MIFWVEVFRWSNAECESITWPVHKFSKHIPKTPATSQINHNAPLLLKYSFKSAMQQHHRAGLYGQTTARNKEHHSTISKIIQIEYGFISIHENMKLILLRCPQVSVAAHIAYGFGNSVSFHIQGFPSATPCWKPSGERYSWRCNVKLGIYNCSLPCKQLITEVSRGWMSDKVKAMRKITQQHDITGRLHCSLLQNYKHL